MAPQEDLSAPQKTHITITTYNVISARGPKLQMVLRAMSNINTDIALLTETKLCDDRYACTGHGFSVVATQVPTTQQGGVALVWRTTAVHWILEGVRTVTANVISATLVSGNQRWLLIGAYLAPSCDPDNELTAIETEYRRHPRLPMILLGNFNADLDKDNCDRAIAVATTAQHLGVEDSFHKHIQRKQRRHTFHRKMTNGSHQHSRCDYILVDPGIAVRSLRVITPLDTTLTTRPSRSNYTALLPNYTDAIYITALNYQRSKQWPTKESPTRYSISS